MQYRGQPSWLGEADRQSSLAVLWTARRTSRFGISYEGTHELGRAIHHSLFMLHVPRVPQLPTVSSWYRMHRMVNCRKVIMQYHI